MQLHTEWIQSHREVSSSLRILNIRPKPLKWAMCLRDSWRREWQIMVMCPLIAVFLSRFAAKFSTNGRFFSCEGLLPDMGTAVPTVYPRQKHESQRGQFRHLDKYFPPSQAKYSCQHTHWTWFLCRSHLYTILVYTLKEASSFRAEMFQVLSQNSVVTNSLLLRGLGNPVACNVHGSQVHRALISHLLLLQCICHTKPTIYNHFLPLV